MTALEQPALFDPEQFASGTELLAPREEQQHRFTGEIVARNEAKYAAIVRALGQGMGRRQIARAFGVSHHTVQAIFEREPALVATEKEKTGRQLRRVVRMSLDALEEALEEGRIAPGQLPVTTAILVDKSLNWDGQSTATVTVRHEVDQAKVRALFETLQRPYLEAEIVAPDSGSGETAASSPTKGLICDAVVADVVDVGQPVATVAQSGQSAATHTATRIPPGFDTAPPSTITTTTNAPTPKEGGGGFDLPPPGARG